MITTQGLTVVDEGIELPIVVMAWGVGRQPVHTAMDPESALRIAVDLIAAANRRLLDARKDK